MEYPMKIAILDDYANAAMRLADWSPYDVTVFNDTTTDHRALVERLTPFDIICLMRERTPMPATLINALPNLKLLVTSGPKNASIDLNAAKAAGVTVCGTPSRKTTTSELATLMMLALNRRLMPEVASLHGAAGWQTGLGRDLAGLTLGVIGLGNIGAQMAALGRAFGMEVCAWSQNLTQARADEVGVTRMECLTDLMAASDVTTVHLVLSERSKGLLKAFVKSKFAIAQPFAGVVVFFIGFIGALWVANLCTKVLQICFDVIASPFCKCKLQVGIYVHFDHTITNRFSDLCET
jgi:phosphoglycerate dehydrogenase-like enzyme